MYKLLIIDDEYLVRIGIEQTIEWKNYGVEIVGAAKNGSEGLEMAKKLNPDIIISDVRMPIMDGLDLVKAINEYKLDTIVIILSGYKDFEYAKETLENGAFQYLLKPIDNEQLVDAVLKAIEQINLRRSNQQKIKTIDNEIPLITQTILQNLIGGNYTNIDEIIEKIKIYHLQIPEIGYVIYGQIDSNEEYDKTAIKLANTDLYNCIKERFDKKGFLHTSIIFYSHFDFLVRAESDQEIITELEQCLKDYETSHPEIISIGISSRYERIEKVYEKYLDAKKNASNKLLLTMNTITSDKEKHTSYRKIITDMIQYISKHYNENLSVQVMAKKFNVSESHLMHLFKEEVGKTFNECLVEYRIEIAKKLLLLGKYRIYEIANLVGYDDSKYFSQVFKKVEGITPGDYITNNNNKE